MEEHFANMSQMLLYIFPLILGRTFDMRTMIVGPDIFTEEESKKFVEIHNPFTETKYKIVNNNQEARNLLDVSGAFSLNVKSGIFNAGVSGEYLTDTYNRENVVEVLVKAYYETVTETLSSNARPLLNWSSKSSLGTHYVKSITYGGELIASVRFLCNDTKNKMKVAGALEGGGRIEIFDIGASVEGNYLSDIAKSIETTEIKVFSSVPNPKVVHDIKELKEMLDAFPEAMKNLNNGKGGPIKVELQPLNYLDSSRPLYLQNSFLNAHLDLFEEKFDDLLNTKTAIEDWMKIESLNLEDDQETQIGNFYHNILDVMGSFERTVIKLDTSSDIVQLQSSLVKYGESLPGSYFHQYLNLRQEIMNDIGEWFPYKGKGGVYTHYGRQNCTEKGETLYSGFTAGYSDSTGALCLPFKAASNKTNDELLTNHKRYECSVCLLPNRKSVTRFLGMLVCPRNWDLVYHGSLTSDSISGPFSDIVCLETVSDNTRQLLSRKSNKWFELKVETETNSLDCIVCAK